MNETEIYFEYGLPDSVFVLSIVGIFGCAVFLFLTAVVLEDFWRKEKRLGRFALVGTTTIAAACLMLFVNGFVQDNRQNDRDKERLEAGFAEVLAEVKLTPADEIKVANTVEDSRKSPRGTTKELELSTGIVTLAYPANDKKLVLSYEEGAKKK